VEIAPSANNRFTGSISDSSYFLTAAPLFLQMDLRDGMSFLMLRVRNNVHPAAGCTLETCPVSESVYGYLPSKPLNIVFLAIFALSLIVHVFQGIRHRSLTFLVALALGTFTEAVGKYPRRIDIYNRCGLIAHRIFWTGSNAQESIQPRIVRIFCCWPVKSARHILTFLVWLSTLSV
jgi:hypothetical protein